MANQFLQNNLKPNQNGNVEVKCQICLENTNLDTASVDAIFMVI